MIPKHTEDLICDDSHDVDRKFNVSIVSMLNSFVFLPVGKIPLFKENVGKHLCKIRVQSKQRFLQLDLTKRKKSSKVHLLLKTGHYGWFRIKHNS